MNIDKKPITNENSSEKESPHSNVNNRKVIVLKKASGEIKIWYSDNNLAQAANLPSDFKEKFYQLDTWEKAREVMDVYMIRANAMLKVENFIDDDFLKNYLIPVLNDSNIQLTLNATGAGKLNYEGKNKDTYLEKEIELIKKINNMGGHVDYISLQSILSKPVYIGGELVKDEQGKKVDYTMELRIKDVVDYAKILKDISPDTKLGFVDALLGKGQDYQSIYKALITALHNENLELHFITLDCPYETPQTGKNGMSWQKIKEMETFVKSEIKCEFGLIATSKVAGHKSDKDFHDTVLDFVNQYEKAGGKPDYYLINSWFPHPEYTIPETAGEGEYPAMKTVVEFAKRVAGR